MLGYNRSSSSYLGRRTLFRSQTGSNGFTLIETLVVISVLAIVAAVTIPNMIGWRSGMQFRAAVNELRSDLESARTRAVRENETVTVNFLPAAGQYQMTYPDDNGTPILLKSQTLPAGVRINSTNNANFSTSFTSRGTAQPRTITLDNLRGKTKSISISFLGRIEVQGG